MVEADEFTKDQTEAEPEEPEVEEPKEGPLNEDIVDMLIQATSVGLSPSKKQDLQKFGSIGKQFSRWLNISEASAQMDVQRRMSGSQRLWTWALLVIGGLAAYRYFVDQAPDTDTIDAEGGDSEGFEDMDIDDMMGEDQKEEEEQNAATQG